jgi:hypothetical protein
MPHIVDIYLHAPNVLQQLSAQTHAHTTTTHAPKWLTPFCVFGVCMSVQAPQLCRALN